MRLGYFIPTYNQIDWVLDKHLPSLDASLFEYVHVHHNYLVDTSSVSRVDSFKLRAPLLFTHTSQNLGVAATWNLFCNFAIEQGIDVAFIANDDIILNDQTLPRMCDKLRETRLDGIVCYGGDNEFSLFAIPLRVYNIIGKFDENFFPAYFEDNDYRFRMKLHKIPVYLLESPGYFHRGSSTINAFDEDDMRQHHENFRKNERYYINKWGGPPGKETVPTS
jgi:GT2 family glycosyltransferase